MNNIVCKIKRSIGFSLHIGQVREWYRDCNNTLELKMNKEKDITRVISSRVFSNHMQKDTLQYKILQMTPSNVIHLSRYLDWISHLDLYNDEKTLKNCNSKKI